MSGYTASDLGYAAGWTDYTNNDVLTDEQLSAQGYSKTYRDAYDRGVMDADRSNTIQRYRH